MVADRPTSVHRARDESGHRRLLKRGMAMGIGLASVLLVSEIAIRILAPFPMFVHEMNRAYPADQYDERYGWCGVPSLDTPFALWEFSTRIQHNDMGFRDESFSAKLDAAPDKHRVVFLGDSYAWGWGVEPEMRITEQLEAIDPTVVTINLGQAGYGTDQQYLVLRDLGPQLRPDTVVVLFCCNDFEDISKRIAYRQRKPQFVAEGDAIQLAGVPVPDDRDWWARKQQLGQQRGRGTMQWLLTRSHLYNWFTYKLDLISQTAGARSGDATRERSAAQTPEHAALMEMLLAAVRDEAQRLHARLILVLIPQREQVANSNVDRSWQTLMKATCTNLGIDCLDLYPHLAGQLRAYWRLDPHWTPAGHRLGAESLGAFLRTREQPPR